jgi:hypothetical protein
MTKADIQRLMAMRVPRAMAYDWIAKELEGLVASNLAMRANHPTWLEMYLASLAVEAYLSASAAAQTPDPLASALRKGDSR